MQPLKKCTGREGKSPERMVLGDETNLAASSSSSSEVRISEDEISILHMDQKLPSIHLS